MSSQASGSDQVHPFDRLHPEIRRWIREEDWNELRPVQDRAIRAILDGSRDLVIAAATAAGKTEAAFLPLLTQAAERQHKGVAVLYVSPLKALINDQHRRLEPLCERLDLPVVRWHGDAPVSAKRSLLKDPRGLILITPESIEALFLRRTNEISSLLGSLDAIIVDELHAFLQGPRGLHLASLLRRIDRLTDHRARRVGLSATLGDFSAAKAWVSAGREQFGADLVIADNDQPELKLQVRGYVEPPDDKGIDDIEADGRPSALSVISDHLFANLRGSNNLIFAGSRRTVEALADRLRRRCESAGVPEEFFPHHGSLSKDLRETLEHRLKAGSLPTTAVATTTLELGIDLGSVKSVAQVGAPRSLASLRQRLGRSGRRAGSPAILRIYVREKYLAADCDPLERLRLDTIRAVAAVRLLVEKFIEPPTLDPSLLTVALHQLLSVITQEGGARAHRLYLELCTDGPFKLLSKSDFATMLRSAAEAALVEQAPDGLIMLGARGERLVASRDFYAVFESDEEWRLVAGGRILGTIPIVNALGVGSIIGFAGRRWRVTAVDDRARVLEITSHPSGRLPMFDRLSLEPIHDRLALEMLRVFTSADLPPYLDGQATELLIEGRAAFDALGLAENRFVRSGDDTHVLTWRGTAVNSILAVLLTAAGFECEAHDVGVTAVDSSVEDVRGMLDRVAQCPPLEDLSPFVKTLRSAKFDEFLADDFLARYWAKRNEPFREAVSSTIQCLQSSAACSSSETTEGLSPSP
jgi:ATP-dependent Lhr-like helicase